MGLDKERLRTIYGIAEPTGSTDSAVLARRRFHKTAAMWLAKWSYPMQAVFALVGFVVVLLPMFSKNWRAVIESTPIVERVFHDFSSLSGCAMVLFFGLMAIFLVLNCLVNDYPGGWHPTKQWGFPSPKQVVEMELYPRLKREEVVFWIDIVFGIAGTAIWMIFFGVFAFFINLGG